MKINIAHPLTGQQKKLDIEDDSKLRIFYDRRLAAEVEGDALGEEFKGYIFKIAGGQDRQGFPMKQGVLTSQRVRVLMKPGQSGFRGHNRREGEKRRKSVRGCIVSHETAVLNLIITRKGDNELPGLTDEEKPKMKGPKRATKIRKLFLLDKSDDLRPYVETYSKKKEKNGKTFVVAPRIQRLVTPTVLQRRRRRISLKKQSIDRKHQQATEYKKLLMQRLKEQRERRSESLAKKRAQRLSQASNASMEKQ